MREKVLLDFTDGMISGERLSSQFRFSLLFVSIEIGIIFEFFLVEINC